MRKCIKIIDQNGDPAINAYIIPQTGNETWTNLDGKAYVNAKSPDEIIKITHVSGQEVNMKYKDLPEILTLEINTLDEVLITANPKKKKKVWPWVLGAAAVLFLFSGETPKKIKL